MRQFTEEPLHLTASDGSGYFPAYPGLKLCDGRFEIIRKIGRGPRKSVWMATDTKEPPDEYVALAILTEHESQLGIEKANRALVNKRGIGSFLESFTLQNPNSSTTISEGSSTASAGGDLAPRNHECLVIPLRGESCNVLRSRSPTGALPITHAQHLIITTLGQLGRFHKRSMVYGAVSLDNILTNPSLRTDSVLQLLGETDSTRIRSKIDKWETVDGASYPLVRSQPLPCGRNWDDDIYTFADCYLILSNLGHVQALSSRERGTATWDRARMPRAIRPPEAILDLPYTVKADVWQLGCAGFHLLLGEEFVPHEMAGDDNTLLAWMVTMCGPVPSEMVARSGVASSYLNADGVPHDGFSVGPLLEARVREKGIIPDEEIPGVMWFLNACLALDPEQRIDLDTLWESDWLRAAAWDWH